MKHSCATLYDILGRKPNEDGSYWEAKAAIDTCIGGTRADTEAARGDQFSDVYSRDIGYTEGKADMAIDISRHAFKRAKERCGLPKRAVARTALRAFELGQVTRDQQWILSNSLSITSSRLILSYGNFYYVYELSTKNPKLVTIISTKK